MEVKDLSDKTAPHFAEMIELRLQDGGVIEGEENWPRPAAPPDNPSYLFLLLFVNIYFIFCCFSFILLTFGGLGRRRGGATMTGHSETSQENVGRVRYHVESPPLLQWPFGPHVSGQYN